MKVIFVLFYLPVLFSTTHAPELLPLVEGDASSSTEATFCEDRVLTQCLTRSCICPALHTPVEPLNGEKALIHGRNILPVPMGANWNDYPYALGSSQAPSLLNQPMISVNNHEFHSIQRY